MKKVLVLKKPFCMAPQKHRTLPTFCPCRKSYLSSGRRKTPGTAAIAIQGEESLKVCQSDSDCSTAVAKLEAKEILVNEKQFLFSD